MFEFLNKKEVEGNVTIEVEEKKKEVRTMNHKEKWISRIVKQYDGMIKVEDLKLIGLLLAGIALFTRSLIDLSSIVTYYSYSYENYYMDDLEGVRFLLIILVLVATVCIGVALIKTILGLKSKRYQNLRSDISTHKVISKNFDAFATQIDEMDEEAYLSYLEQQAYDAMREVTRKQVAFAKVIPFMIAGSCTLIVTLFLNAFV